MIPMSANWRQKYFYVIYFSPIRHWYSLLSEKKAFDWYFPVKITFTTCLEQIIEGINLIISDFRKRRDGIKCQAPLLYKVSSHLNQYQNHINYWLTNLGFISLKYNHVCWLLTYFWLRDKIFNLIKAYFLPTYEISFLISINTLCLTLLH